jgi:hypothetical protein
MEGKLKGTGGKGRERKGTEWNGRGGEGQLHHLLIPTFTLVYRLHAVSGITIVVVALYTNNV